MSFVFVLLSCSITICSVFLKTKLYIALSLLLFALGLTSLVENKIALRGIAYAGCLWGFYEAYRYYTFFNAFDIAYKNIGNITVFLCVYAAVYFFALGTKSFLPLKQKNTIV